ncbi:MAG: LysE family translocator [Pseudomonadota bacterium]
MIELSTLFAYSAASIALIIVPGPTVTVIIANSLRYGARSGLINIAGTQLGIALMVVVLAFGLDFIVREAGYAFEVLRWVGAAYLIWLGVKLWRSNGDLGSATAGPSKSDSAYFWQGFLVILSNPKMLVFFGAFIPQFVDPSGNTVAQTLIFGALFMAYATLFDSAYALFAGRAGSILSKDRVRLVERLSGTALIGGGLWLAFSKGARA